VLTSYKHVWIYGSIPFHHFFPLTTLHATAITIRLRPCHAVRVCTEQCKNIDPDPYRCRRSIPRQNVPRNTQSYNYYVPMSPKPKVKCRSIDQKVSERTRVASPVSPLPRQHVRLRTCWTSISEWHSNAPPSCTNLIKNCSRASIQTCMFSHQFSLYRQTTPKSIRMHLSQLLARQPTSRVCLQPITGQCEAPTGSKWETSSPVATC